MMKKDKLLIKMFLGIIFGIFLLLPINFLLVKFGVIEVNKDNWVTYISKDENNVINKIENVIGKVKNGIENRVTNYFPLYNQFNKVYKDFNFYTNKIFYDKIYIGTNSDKEYLFYDKVNKFYYLENKYKAQELDQRVESQIKFFNTFSDLDVSIYIPTRYELTTLSDSGLNKYIDIFKSKIDSNINVEVMDIKSIDEYKDKFYLTDHHWNINGALDGYRSIAKMLEFEDVNDFNFITNKDRKFYGSFSKSALNDDINDYILDIDIKEDYDVTINGKKKDELFKPRKIRLDRNYKYYDYYVQYFNGQYGNIIYDYHNEEKDNLLILSDSYVWQIDYLIAKHYNKTHVINLRYDEYENNNFNLREYVSSNDISKILFLYEGGSILFDQYNYDFVGRVK